LEKIRARIYERVATIVDGIEAVGFFIRLLRCADCREGLLAYKES
jgi:hypothetical protein